jgi:hypothetical protein
VLPVPVVPVDWSGVVPVVLGAVVVVPGVAVLPVPVVPVVWSVVDPGVPGIVVPGDVVPVVPVDVPVPVVPVCAATLRPSASTDNVTHRVLIS